MPENRLPNNIKPKHYEIHLTVDLENFTYSGKQNVYIDILEKTKIIVLHSLNLNIKAVSYNIDDNLFANSQSIDYDTSNEIVTINFDKEIPPGNLGFLAIDFNGVISKQLNGFYRSQHTSQTAAITQFAPTDARRCFPCWDEPAIKATFDITLTTHKKYVVISNMPIKSTKKIENNLIRTIFEKTPIMSTYLVAFIISEYCFIENFLNKRKIRVYSPKDKLDQCKFTLDVAMKCLPFYENYFDIPYPLSKIDLVATDMSYGAMENWGLITFRDTIIHVDSNSSTDKKEKAALIIAHELAHQWFGNLVTMEWWTHLWLNEGYAAFMETLCVDNLFPEYNTWSQFLTNKHIKALELDSLINTHPIEVSVKNSSEITEIFDEISYNKGASVIRMIYNYIGDEDFKNGMSLYLKRYSYSNVKTQDLWRALEETSGKPISRIISNWTKMPGFPLISVVEKINASDTKNRVLTISQERFYINGNAIVNKTNTTWMIPIFISCADDPKRTLKTIILDEKIKNFELEGISKDSWIKINAGTVGFFRTSYSSDLLKKLLLAVQDNSLPVFDRLGLLDDLFATAQAGYNSTVEYLKLLKEFKNESDYIIWSSITSNLRKINHILSESDEIQFLFLKFCRNLLREVYTKLGWSAKKNENHLNTLLRTLILSHMIKFCDESAVEEAKRLFELHVTKQSILPADLREIVYRAVLTNGNKDTFEKMLSLYRETNVNEEKNRILSSLGAMTKMDVLQRILEFLTTEEVRAQDMIYAVKSVTNCHQGRVLAWQYFKSNWKLFVKRCQAVTSIVAAVTEGFTSEDVIPDIEEFFEKNNISGTDRTVKQSIERITFNAAWLNRDKESLLKFLNNHQS